MPENYADALVLFGAGGDLAAKMIYPALHALRGDRTVFERARGIEAAWRIVDPLQQKPPPVAVYARGSWGPAAAARIVGNGHRWHDPQPL
jgi:glucose-6-phosphate 1-dehydrogenase